MESTDHSAAELLREKALNRFALRFGLGAAMPGPTRLGRFTPS